MKEGGIVRVEGGEGRGGVKGEGRGGVKVGGVNGGEKG